jgi:Putative lumazine-binding
MQTNRSIPYFSILLFANAASAFAQANIANIAPTTDVAATAETTIRQVVNESYCNGAYNALDTKRMAQGFHADFAILGADGDAIERYPIKTWIAAIDARKAKPGFDPASAVRDCQIVSIDVTGDVATVKAKITKAGKLQYTDYLSMIKFKSGWKIAAKIYAEHP